MRKSPIVVGVCAFVLFALVATAQAAHKAQHLRAQAQKSTQVVRFFEHRGRWLRAPRHERCSDVPWPKSCVSARASYALHTRLLRAAKRKLWLILPATNDWRTAVRITQRPYPGTDGWLLSCSKSEGGWGSFVMNREGSGVGGNMQMYPSTFWTMMYGYYLPAHGRTYPGAVADLKARGFVVPRSALDWHSPLGQALASAYGKLHGRGGEWHGSGC